MESFPATVDIQIRVVMYFGMFYRNALCKLQLTNPICQGHAAWEPAFPKIFDIVPRKSSVFPVEDVINKIEG
jgi:hypothetical protein